jgi:hypothetical protein
MDKRTKKLIQTLKESANAKAKAHEHNAILSKKMRAAKQKAEPPKEVTLTPEQIAQMDQITGITRG